MSGPAYDHGVMYIGATRTPIDDTMSPPTHHQALVIPALKEKFTQITVPTPRPGPGQVLIQVKASGLNTIEYKIQKLGIYLKDFPAILGCDVAGVVVDVGEGVSAFAVGDRVFYQSSWWSTKAGYQQYCLSETHFTAKIPDHLSFDEAATLPSSLFTSTVGLFSDKPYGAGLTPPWESPSALGKYAGNPIAIIGGASSLGQAAIQLCRLSGFSPIIATASQKHEPFLKSLGATHVIDRGVPLDSLAAEIAKVTSAPIKLLFDAVSNTETLNAAYDVLSRSGGQLVAVHPAKEGVVKKDGVEYITTLGDLTLPRARTPGMGLYAHMSGLLEDGSILPHRAEVLSGGLDAIAGGLERHERGEVSGVKLLVHPDESA